jgi:glucose uptake protein GlcU
MFVVFAQVFRIGGIERDFLQSMGLALAAVLLGMLAFRHVRSDAAKRPRLVATLALLALVVVIWSATEAAARLCAALADEWGRNAR